MDLDNPFETVVYHLLIEGMDGLSYRDEIHMVSELVCMVTH